MMKIYKVGGCVRDSILGKIPKDIDYVVVGSSPEEMSILGFQQVGADFPVFLHPETKEEYALARREKKTGPGYHGFETEFSSDVTLEEDLGRRDLTINAMAQDIETGEIIDPFGGREDLRLGIICHVSDAFMEDPLRIIRAIRFTARFKFKMNYSTFNLIVDNFRSLSEIKNERIVLEMLKGVETNAFHFLTMMCDITEEIEYLGIPGLIPLKYVPHRVVDELTDPEAKLATVYVPDHQVFGGACTKRLCELGQLFESFRELVPTVENIHEFVRRHRKHLNDSDVMKYCSTISYFNWKVIRYAHMFWNQVTIPEDGDIAVAVKQQRLAHIEEILYTTGMESNISEEKFKKFLKERLEMYRGKVDFVTGPGRSGAVAAVYASYFLGVPFLPFGVNTTTSDTVLVVDTIEQSGRTLRKAAKKYENSIPVSICGHFPLSRHHFWFENQS